MSTPTIDVWGNRSSTCTQRILFTAAEANLPINFHKIDFAKGEHKDPAYIAKRQPFGKVPAAEIDGLSFFESRAISRVIAEYVNGGNSTLLPREMKQKAIFEQWASLELGTYTPTLEQIVFERVFKKWHGLETDENRVKDLWTKSQGNWKILDAHLATNQYVLGSSLTLIDIFFTPYLQHFVGLPEGKELLANYPNIKAWWERLSANANWQKVLKEQSL